jgi:hypothetical protein
MDITYTVAEYATEDTSVQVTYTNESGFEHKRTINIPHLEDGSIDQDYFSEILEGQLRGVENKVVVGAITFIDPNEVEEPVSETPAP